MSESYPHIEQIEKYLSGSMSQEEQQAFEAQIEVDEKLALELRTFLGAQFAGHAHMREQQELELRKRYNANSTGAGFSLYPNILYYAAAAILIFVLVWVVLPGSPDYDRLYASYYEPVPAPVIRDTSQSEARLRLAHISFNQGQFDQAIKSYEQLLADDASQGRDIALFLGQAYMNQGQTDLAIRQFERAESSPQEAQWFTALALLRAGRLAEAKTQLEMIRQNPSHFYGNKAASLLEEL